MLASTTDIVQRHFGGGRDTAGSGEPVCQLTSLGIFVFVQSVFYVACTSLCLTHFFNFICFYSFYFVYVTTAGGEQTLSLLCHVRVHIYSIN